MNLKFFKKDNKLPSLKSFHNRPISPERDWLIIMFTCFIYVSVAVVMSTALFIVSMSTDISDAGDTQSLDGQSIDIDKLNSALDFISSRGK